MVEATTKTNKQKKKKKKKKKTFRPSKANKDKNKEKMAITTCPSVIWWFNQPVVCFECLGYISVSYHVIKWIMIINRLPWLSATTTNSLSVVSYYYHYLFYIIIFFFWGKRKKGKGKEGRKEGDSSTGTHWGWMNGMNEWCLKRVESMINLGWCINECFFAVRLLRFE